MDAYRVAGLTALVTGAGSGIGRATAVALAQAGAARVYLAGRRDKPLAETAKLVQAASCKAVVVEADVGAATGRKTLVEAVRAGGRLDILVNNAGLFEGANLRDTSDALWQRHIDVNATAPLALTRDLLDLLAKGPAASVLNISSTLAEKPIPGAAAYNAAKAAVVQLTRSLALELGPTGVRVNCILPAIVETPMYAGRYASDKEYKAGLEVAAKLHPLGRIGKPEDIAHAVVFLASPAAAWITGVALPVDGGMLCT